MRTGRGKPLAWAWFGLSAHLRTPGTSLALCGLGVSLALPREGHEPAEDERCAGCTLHARLRPREYDLDTAGLLPLMPPTPGALRLEASR